METEQISSGLENSDSILLQCRARKQKFKKATDLMKNMSRNRKNANSTENFLHSELFFLAQEAYSCNSDTKYTALKKIRESLENTEQSEDYRQYDIQPILEEVLDVTFISLLIDIMEKDDNPDLQIEALKIFKKCTKGLEDQTEVIVKPEIINLLIKTIRSFESDIAIEAIETIGNIIEDSSTLRDTFLDFGGLNPLLMFLEKTTDNQALSIGTWTLANLCRKKYASLLTPAIKTIEYLLNRNIAKTSFCQVLANLLRALEYITDGNQDLIESVSQSSIIRIVAQNLDTTKSMTIYSSLAIINNILCGDNSQVDRVLEAPGLVDKLMCLARDESRFIRSLACCAISNIAAGAEYHVEALLKKPKHLEQIILVANSDNSPDVRREAIGILNNIILNGGPSQIVKAIELGVINCFLAKLDSQDHQAVGLALKGLNCLLSLDFYDYDYYKDLDEEEIDRRISKKDIKNCLLKLAQEHQSLGIKTLAEEVYKRHFMIF